MSELVRTIIVMSVTGSILAFLLLLLKPLVKNRLPKSAQYYLWLVVVVALLVPISYITTQVNLPDFSRGANSQDTPGAAAPAALPGLPALQNMPVLQNMPAIPAIPTISETVTRFVVTQAEQQERLQNMPAYTQEAQNAGSPLALFITYFVLAYPFGVLALMLYFVVNYMIFAGLYRRRNRPAHPYAKTLLAKMCKGRVPRIYANPLADTPMLLGVFRPVIILPDLDYSPAQLDAILSHELTHLRRKDIFVKWLTLAASALHWFNPVMWLIRREIDRACELSCDEAVITHLDLDGKENYGYTLIAVSANSKAPTAVSSATMCEEKKNLRERLGAIMKSKKHTKLAVALSALMIFSAACMVLVLGVGCSSNQSTNDTENTDPPAASANYRTPYVSDVASALFSQALTEFFAELAPAPMPVPFDQTAWDLQFQESYHAVLVDMDGNGTPGVIASKWAFTPFMPADPTFMQALFYVYNDQLHTIDPWNLPQNFGISSNGFAVAPNGRFVGMNFADGQGLSVRMYTLFNREREPFFVPEISLSVTEYWRREDGYGIQPDHDGNDYMVLYHDGANPERDHAITHDEFNELMAQHGLQGTTNRVWDLPNEAGFLTGLGNSIGDNITTSFVATLHIGIKNSELLSGFRAVHESDFFAPDPQHRPPAMDDDWGIAIWANTMMSDVRAISIDFGFENDVWVPFVSYGSRITDFIGYGDVLVFNQFMTVGGVLPREGIMFMDPGTGQMRYFAIEENRMDGNPPFFLTEFIHDIGWLRDVVQPPAADTPTPDTPTALAGADAPPHIILQGTRISTDLTELPSNMLWNVDFTQADLEQLRHMVNLEQLFFTSSYVTDLSPLSGLTNLRHLGIGDSPVSDLSPIAGLTNLIHFSANGGHISDLSPLANMNLEFLHLPNNQITDISPLANSTNMVELGLDGNQISDISALANMRNLAILSLGMDSSFEWGWLSGTSGNLVSDISPLSGLTNLVMLYLDSNQISDISPLANLHNLNRLEFRNNQVSDLSPLSGLQNLEVLIASNNQISDLSPLEGMNLEFIAMTHNQISDLAPLANIPSLQNINFTNNQINDVSPLALWSLSNLRGVQLSNNLISDVSPLLDLTAQLEVLHLVNNQISDVYPLRFATAQMGVLWLMLHGNPITDWSPLSHVVSVGGRPYGDYTSRPDWLLDGGFQVPVR